MSFVNASGDIASRRRSSGLSDTNSRPRLAISSTVFPFLIVVPKLRSSDAIRSNRSGAMLLTLAH